MPVLSVIVLFVVFSLVSEELSLGWIGRILLGVCMALAVAFGNEAKAAEPEGITVGAHLVTAHTKPEGKESGTPGLYLRWPNGITVGAYRNSYGDGSVYAGYTFEAFNRHLALTVGAVTGYRAQPVLPLVVPSLRIGLWGDTSLRVAYLPKPPKYGSSAAVHFSVEARF